MKTRTLLFAFIAFALTNLSAQDFQGILNGIEPIKATNVVISETASVQGLNVVNRNSASIGPISAVSDSSKIKRFSFNLYMGLGARVPLSDSFYNLWDDLALGGQRYEASDGWSNAIASNWGDYFFSFIRTDFDFSISKNISIGLSAYPDKYKKMIAFSDKTDNWTGNGSNGLEDHWEVKRRLRMAAYNFGPDIKFKVPIRNLELNLTYLYGWSYLFRSSFEFSYYSQLTGTGERGYLGLLYIADGNITKLRYHGNSVFHRIELGITNITSDDENASVSLKVGYQFLKMNNVRYEVLKYDSEVLFEASNYFIIGVAKEYQVGDTGDVYIDNDRFNLDVRSYYISIILGFHWPKNKVD